MVYIKDNINNRVKRSLSNDEESHVDWFEG
jgi:hypothetical protein